MIEYNELKNAKAFLDESFKGFENLPLSQIRKNVCDALFIVNHLIGVNKEERGTINNIILKCPNCAGMFSGQPNRCPHCNYVSFSGFEEIAIQYVEGEKK